MSAEIKQCVLGKAALHGCASPAVHPGERGAWHLGLSMNLAQRQGAAEEVKCGGW